MVQKVNGFSSGLCVLCFISINERTASNFHCKDNVFVEIFFLLTIIQFHWTRKLALLTVVFLVFHQPRFHAALFKYIFRSTKVDFVLFTLTLFF